MKNDESEEPRKWKKQEMENNHDISVLRKKELRIRVIRKNVKNINRGFKNTDFFGNEKF